MPLEVLSVQRPQHEIEMFELEWLARVYRDQTDTIKQIMESKFPSLKHYPNLYLTQ